MMLYHMPKSRVSVVVILEVIRWVRLSGNALFFVLNWGKDLTYLLVSCLSCKKTSCIDTIISVLSTA
jgi:hypothetical protein